MDMDTDMDMDMSMVMVTDITCGKGHRITDMEDTVFIIITAMRIMTLISTISWPIFTQIPMATDHCTTTVIGGDETINPDPPWLRTIALPQPLVVTKPSIKIPYGYGPLHYH